MIACCLGYVQIQIYSDSACTDPIHQTDVSLDFDNEVEGVGYNYHWGYWWYRAWYLEVESVRFQCVDNADQYTFASNRKYAVTEYFPADDTENDQNEQCDVDYTQFAAYQKGYCFGIYKQHYSWDDDWERQSYYQFSANDDTFISLTAYSDDQCSYETSEWYVLNIFPVDTCKQNFYQEYDVSSNAMQKRETRNHATNPFKFDGSTPTAMKTLMTKSLMEAQGKTFVPVDVRVNQKIEERNTALKEHNAKKQSKKHSAKASADKKAEGVAPEWDDDDYQDVNYESGNVYFTDDKEAGSDDDSYYYSYENNAFDDEYYNDFLPGPGSFQALSEYYIWKNVPELVDAVAPKSWFTEVMYGYDSESEEYFPTLASSRQTLTCMPYVKGTGVNVWFNYAVVCDKGKWLGCLIELLV